MPARRRRPTPDFVPAYGRAVAAALAAAEIPPPPVPQARPTPPPPPATPTVPRWTLSRLPGKIVLTVKDGSAALTAREAVALAAHLLANVDGAFRDEDSRRPVVNSQ